ncbi:hypothetical protein [Lysobacter capsici]|uniref:hypothetical protein n=1 Tax=Lysobacter capsici TaxID=435897 RepID=UPI00287B94AB|nr:hypothetical protein [Lysobacter capsici]WND80376.1 hypothetical protein RJ610_24395 [Lysobacter capsici]WND85573.1 hypothetical protein RJ609_24415 [Lysobacter capsici]
MNNRTIKHAVLVAFGMAMVGAAYAGPPTQLPTHACTQANSGETSTVYSSDGPRSYAYTYICTGLNWELIRKCTYTGGPGEPCMEQ